MLSNILNSPKARAWAYAAADLANRAAAGHWGLTSAPERRHLEHVIIPSMRKRSSKAEADYQAAAKLGTRKKLVTP